MTKSNSGKKRSVKIDRLLNFSKNSYLERTSRPFYAAVFLLPFIILYEIGTILINTDVLGRSQIQTRVVSFIWLQDFLRYLGFADKFVWIAAPLAVLIILLSLQIVSKKSWQLFPADLWKMTAESVFLATPLLIFNIALASTPPSAANGQVFQPNIFASIVTAIGAGIYEEFIFRLILISVMLFVLADICRFEHTPAAIFSVIVSAALFSAHHHIDFLTGRQTESFLLMPFLFRTIAGIYFAVLFAVRGFGITAGAHAFYDIIVVFINIY